MARFLVFSRVSGRQPPSCLVIEIFADQAAARYVRMKKNTPVRVGPTAELDSTGKLKLCKQWQVSLRKTM
jgi:hypothetical protein